MSDVDLKHLIADVYGAAASGPDCWPWKAGQMEAIGEYLKSITTLTAERDTAQSEANELRGRVERLESRGIEDMRHEIAELQAIVAKLPRPRRKGGRMTRDEKTALSAWAACLATVYSHTAHNRHLIACVARDANMDPDSISDEERRYLEDQNESDWRLIVECCTN